MALQEMVTPLGTANSVASVPSLAWELERITGVGIVLQVLAYLVRSGPPDSLDRMVAMNYGAMATDLVLDGVTGRMVALRGGSYTNVPISMTREGVKRVDVAGLYDTEQYRPAPDM